MARSFGSGGLTDIIVYPASAAGGWTKRSYSLWFYPRYLGAGARYIYVRAVVDHFYINNGILKYYSYWSSNNGLWKFSDSLVLNQWQHLAIVYDGTLTTNNPTAYLDGVPQVTTRETTVPAGTLADSEQQDVLGNAASAGGGVNAILAEYATWNGLLTTGEIDQLVAGVSPNCIPTRAGLVRRDYVPLFGGATNARNVWRGTNGTITGAVAASHPTGLTYPSPDEGLVPELVAMQSPLLPILQAHGLYVGSAA